MSKEDERAYDALIEFKGFEGVSNEIAIRMIGQLIDLSGDLKRADGTNRALEWCDTVALRGLTNLETALLAYFRANAWENRHRERRRKQSVAWAWEQPEIQQQSLHLRGAISLPGFAEMDSLRRCQILTNLANVLNTVGRFVDALEYWDRALQMNPRFGMALGNRGYGLEHYAKALYDQGHRAQVLFHAHQGLSAALSQQAFYEGEYYGAKRLFAAERAQIGRALDVEKVSKIIDSHEHSLGNSDEEQRYRSWCLQNRLFLNPLNDLGNRSVAARDVLMLPTFITPLHEPPTLIGFFNQMKQEFASARWLFYEGSRANEVHFSDRGVLLCNTLDYPSYSLAVEKVKAAFRVAYSIFDKMGFFLNDYMTLGIDADKVYFKSIWYQKYNAQPRKIRCEFEDSENWPLRGLFWLSKDLFDKDFQAATEPDARALYEIRNHLEHKYLKVHEMLLPRTHDESLEPWVTDRLAYSVQRRDLEAKTLRLLKLSRAGLIYLSLGMHRMEQIRQRGKDQTRVGSISLDLWDDDWKV
jgi:tetratricopeptide (TPR) repeat protein